MAYIYMTHHNPAAYVTLPIYKIKGDVICRTHHHPDGYFSTPVMEIRGTSIHMTRQNPAKFIAAPIYDIKDDLIYMTQDHPDTHIAAEVMRIRQLTPLSVPISVTPLADLVINLVPNFQVRKANMPSNLGFDDQHK